MWSDKERDDPVNTEKQIVQISVVLFHNTYRRPAREEWGKVNTAKCLSTLFLYINGMLKRQHYLRWLSGELYLNFNYEGGSILKNDVPYMLALNMVWVTAVTSHKNRNRQD